MNSASTMPNATIPMVQSSPRMLGWRPMLERLAEVKLKLLMMGPFGVGQENTDGGGQSVDMQT